jgi:hypothetical protein
VAQRVLMWWLRAMCWGRCRTHSSVQHSYGTCGVSEYIQVLGLRFLCLGVVVDVL